MSVRGSLRTMCIEDVFDWIDKRQLVGQLSLDRGGELHSFTCHNGVIIGASSNDPGERLSQLLLSRELVDEAQLRDAFRIQEETGVFLGKVLLLSDALDEGALTDVLELKIQAAVWEVLSWQDGQFEFTEGASDGLAFPVRVQIRTTMDLGKLQVQRWRSIREQIFSDSMKFWVSDFFAIHSPEDSGRIRGQTEQLVEYIGRGLSVNQMILENHGRRFQVMSRLADLMSRGAITEDRRGEQLRAKTRDTAEIEAAAREKASEGNRGDALALAARALQRDTENVELQALHSELQRSVMAELSREYLNTFRVPKVIIAREKIEGLALSDNERYLLNRIDGHWDLLSLMRISPIQDVDVLLTCKRLQERGIIEL